MRNKDVYLPKWLLIFGIVLIVVAALFGYFSAKTDIRYLIITAVLLAVGIAAILCWKNQWIEMTGQDGFIYSTMFGNKKEYKFADIVSIKPNADSITLIMKEGKVHIEACAKVSDEFNRALYPSTGDSDENNTEFNYGLVQETNGRRYDDLDSDQSYRTKSFDTVLREMQEEEASMKAGARKGILLGLLILACGLGITLIGYFTTEPGGTYRMLTGVIIIGVFGAVKGLISYIALIVRLNKYEKEVWTDRLGHAPTAVDDEYVQFKQKIHTPGEKVKTILILVLVVACLAFTCYVGYCIIGNHPILPGVSNSFDDPVQEKLFNEIADMSDQLHKLDKEITEYEEELDKLEEKYNESPSKELADEYNAVYEKYTASINEYNELVDVYNEKYDYYEATYGF